MEQAEHARFAAFLRGINVTGRRVKGPELVAAFEAVGFRDVATFRASGNVIFSADQEEPERIGLRIEEGLAKALGYEVLTFVRSAREVRAISAHEPFPKDRVEASRGKLQVALLARKPTAAARKKVLALAGDDDVLAIRSRELYWLPSGGIMESALDFKAIDGIFGLSTVRTKNTIDQIAAKHFGR
jgi:uncharacterized protein (DUF1697 family)